MSDWKLFAVDWRNGFVVGDNDGGKDCEKCLCFVGNLGCADNGDVLPLRSEQALFAIDGLRTGIAT